MDEEGDLGLPPVIPEPSPQLLGEFGGVLCLVGGGGGDSGPSGFSKQSTILSSAVLSCFLAYANPLPLVRLGELGVCLSS